MSHVDPTTPLTSSPQQVLQAFDRTLGRPPFVCSTDVLNAAQLLRDVVLSKSLAELKTVSGIVNDLPIIATSLSLGFSSSPNGFLDAKPLVLILCECLCHVASIIKFPIQDFLATIRKWFPMVRETVALHRACGAIDLDILRTFLGIPNALPPAATTGKPANPPVSNQGKGVKAQGSETKNKNNSGSAEKKPMPAAAPVASLSSSSHQEEDLKGTPPPEVIKELCLAPLSPDGRKLLLKQLDSAAKFSAIVRNDAELASIILSIYGAQLIPLLKPSALIQCMGGEIADVFVELLDKHAVSLAVILDDDPQSNAFALSSLESNGASPWCSGALASLILSAVGQRTILKGAEVQSPFGFVVAMVLWLRVLAASCKTSAAALIQLPVENLRALPNLVLQALNMLGSQQQRFGSQRWLVLLHQALDLLATLVDKHVIDDALTGNTSVLCDLVTPLLQATIAPPVTAPIANPKKQKPAKSSAVEASPALPLLSVLDNQGVVASLLAVASFWAELPGCGTLLEVFVNNMIPWFCTISPRKELTEALSQFLVRTKLVNHVYLKSMEGQSVVTAIIRASSPSSSLVFAQLVSTVSSSSGKLTAATDALLASVVSATSSTSSQHLRDSFLALHAHHSVAEVIDLVVTFCRKQQNISGDAIISRIDHLAIEHSDFKNVVTGVTNELHAIAQKHAADEQKRQSERVAQASCAAQEENLKRQQQAKELNAMRKQYAAMMARRETLSEVAAQRLAHANVALETRNSSRSRTARENLDALRKAEQQAKKNREEALRASVASYRERIAQTRNVTTFLKTLGLSDARAYAVPRELQSRLLSLSPQEVMEYIVHGDAAMPHDLATAAQRYDEREASERQQITFTDEITTSTGVVANGRNQAPSFWELVMADVEQLSSEGQPSSANTADTTATKGNSFHFRVAPLLDLFNFDGEPDENQEPKSVPKKSLPVRYVKQYLEEPCGQGERTPNDNSVSTTWASLCGFEDALHMVYVAQLKGLVKLEKGFIALTPLGHAYHEDFWDPERSLAVTLARRREAAQAALQFAATESANVDNFDDLDNEDVNWFDDELL